MKTYRFVVTVASAGLLSAIILASAVSGGDTFQVNNIGCTQVRLLEGATDLSALAPAPDGRQEGRDVPPCLGVEGGGASPVLSIMATTDQFQQKTTASSLDVAVPVRFDGRPFIGHIYYCIDHAVPDPLTGCTVKSHDDIWTWLDFRRVAAGPTQDWAWRCDPVQSDQFRCIDLDHIELAGELWLYDSDHAHSEPLDVFDGPISVNNKNQYIVASIRTNAIHTSAYIGDPGNDNSYVEGNLTYWKIRDPDLDGSIQLNLGIDLGVTITFLDGHWIIESIDGDPVVVNHEPANQRWAIRLIGDETLPPLV